MRWIASITTMGRTHFLLAVLLLLLSLIVITGADYGIYKQNSNSEMKEKPLPIAVQGTIFCKSGSTYEPIPGAVIRVTCLAVDEFGYETAPFSLSSYRSDGNGYFLAILYPSEISKELKITECRAFLEESPMENCKVPTDDNNGISGALLSVYRLFNDKKMKLYSVGPFFFTNQQPTLLHN